MADIAPLFKFLLLEANERNPDFLVIVKLFGLMHSEEIEDRMIRMCDEMLDNGLLIHK